MAAWTGTLKPWMALSWMWLVTDCFSCWRDRFWNLISPCKHDGQEGLLSDVLHDVGQLLMGRSGL
eukprot:2225880-Prorocentrum_lima.AAC.1